MKVKADASDNSDDSGGSEGNKKNMEIINGQEFDVIDDQLNI